MTRAEELAAELQSSIATIHAELDEIADERWYQATTVPEGWRVGHTAHHIGEGYLLSLSWIERATSDGKPVVLTPEVDIPAVNRANAQCLEEHGNEPRAATMAFMEDSARKLVDMVRSLSDERLDNPMMVVMGQPRNGNLVVLPMALRHATNHLESIRGAS